MIRRNLLQALRKKRPNVLAEQIIFHQDNAPAHRAASTELELDVLGFERIIHPPYSPDLAPMDFCVFPTLKSELRGKRFDNLDQLRFAARTILSGKSVEWYRGIYQTWVGRHRKCIEKAGAYFEKC